MFVTPLRIAGLLLVGAIVLWIAGYNEGGSPCVTKTSNEVIEGASLSGVIESGQRITVAEGYYGCRPVERGDIVVYFDPGLRQKIAKIVKAVEGDVFALALAEGGAKIMINNEAARTSDGIVYRLSDASYRLLSLYERDYGGVMPTGSVLLLGNLAVGTRDSSAFGLVSQSDLVGKVIDY